MSQLPLDEESNWRLLDGLIRPLVDSVNGRPVVLVDGDRTLCPEDTSRVFLRQAGLDPSLIKQRFQAEGYCFNAFRYHAEVHLTLAPDTFARLAAAVGAESLIYPGAAEFLRRAQDEAQVFVVSAGIPRIWRAILDREGLGDLPVIGGIDHGQPYVFGRAEKGRICQQFLAAGSRVIAVGDSDVDAEMMRLAHHCVVVVNHHQNADLIPQLAGHPSVFQVVPQGRAHPDIVELSFETIHLLAAEPETASKRGAPWR